MGIRLGCALRGLILACAGWLCAAPAMAQDVVHEGIAPPGSTGTIALALGNYHSCALRADGEVLCWGYPGQSTPPAGVLFSAIGAGGADTCGVRQDGGVVCWGQTPELAQAPAGPFVSVVVNDQGQACALRAGGAAACWGAAMYTGSLPPPGQGTWLTLSASGDRVCGLLSNRTLECWEPSRARSQRAYPGANYRTISLGYSQVCGLASEGGLRCFDPIRGTELPVGGIYPKGVSAGGSGTCVLELPGFVSCAGSGGFVASAPGNETFTAMIVGNAHACAIRPQGTVACWGENKDGQARPPLSLSGEGAFEEGRPEDPFGRVRALASGRAHSCALLSDGSISCWDAQGSTPMAPPDGRRFVRVAAGGSNTCGVLDDGEVVCRSSNLGAAPAGPFASVAVGDNHACGLRPDGFATCWGNAPWQPPGRFSLLAVDDQFTCGLRLDGRIECWLRSGELRVMPEGPYQSISVRDGFGCGVQQSGDAACWSLWGNAVMSRIPGPLTMVATSSGDACGLQIDGRIECNGYAWPPSEGRYTALSGAGNHYCAIGRAGTVECWGDDYFWEEIAPPKALTLGPVIAAGAWHTCAVGEQGQIDCWGNDDDGQLRAPQGTFATVGSGERHSCALDEAGLTTCWGFAGDGQLDAPAEPLADISIGRMHGCGMTEDGHARCWGWNSNGQATAPEGKFDAIHAGFVHSCGVSASATSPGQCWGYNGDGQLDITYNSGWLEIQAGDRHSCGLTEWGGTIRCWGSDTDGQVSQEPYGEFIALSVGAYHNCAIRVDHSIQCWGADWAGQSQAPPGRFESVSAGSNHTCAIDGEGLRRCWGDDSDGQAPRRTLHPAQPTLVLAANDPSAQLWLMRNGPQGGTSTDAVFRVTRGTLPPGLVLHQDGRLEGPPTTPGRYAITVAAGDEQGFGESREYVLVVDGSPPLITATQSVPAGTGGWHVANAQITWKVREPDTGDVWSEDGCSPVSVTTDTPGTTFTCTAQSAGGTATQSITIRRDVTAPDTQFDPAPPAASGATNAVFGFKGIDATSGIARLECSLDYAAVVACTSPSTFSAGAGAHTLRVWAVDQAGNRDATPATHTWRVDVTAPSVSPLVTGTQGSNGWYVGDVRVDWSVVDAESTITTSCASQTLTTDTAAQVLSCTATSAGGSTTAQVSVRRDTTAPQTTLTATPPAAAGDTMAVFEFAGSDALAGVSGYECSLDGAAYAACTSPMSITVAAGNHQFAVRARDAADNVDATPATHAWTVDATAPVITPVVTGPQGDNGWYVGDVRITWNVADADSAITTATGCSGVVLTSDTTGAAFTCTASSAGGTHSQTVNIRRDATAPTIVAAATTAPNAAGWYRTAVTVAFSCADATSGTSGCPSPQLLGTSGAAVRSAARTIRDAAGNTATSNVVTVAIDRMLPPLAPTAPSPLLLNATGVANATANAKDSLSGVASQSCGVPVTGMLGGGSVGCTATDAAGNTASARAAYRVVYGFQGFTAPVKNPPALNVLQAGRSVPLRWRLVDANGAPVSNLTGAGVTVVPITCPTTATANTITSYGGSSAALRNLGNGYYQMDWLSASSLRGLCRRLELNLGDGQPHAVQFKFD